MNSLSTLFQISLLLITEIFPLLSYSNEVNSNIECYIVFVDAFVDYAKRHIHLKSQLLLEGNHVKVCVVENYDKKRIICIVDITRGGSHPTTIHIKNQSNSIVMISPINHPSIISFSTQQHSKSSSDSYSIEVFKNHTTNKRKLVPLNGLHEGQRCCISGILVKVSPMSKKSEDQLYQVYLIDETTSVPIRFSVYLQSNDTNPYFQYYGTCVILSNISISSYKGVLNGKFLSKYSGIITYHPQTKESFSNDVIIEQSAVSCFNRLTEFASSSQFQQYSGYTYSLNDVVTDDIEFDCVCKVVSICPVRLNGIQSFTLFDDSLVYNQVHTRCLCVDSSIWLAYKNDWKNNQDNLFIKFFNIHSVGEELLYTHTSSYLVIPFGDEFTKNLNHYWKYCHQELEMNDCYRCRLNDTQIPMTSLFAMKTDGIYAIRCSIRSVKSLDSQHLQIVITDGTAECTIVVGEDVLKFFPSVQSFIELEEIFRNPHYCYEFPIAFTTTSEGKEISIVSTL